MDRYNYINEVIEKNVSLDEVLDEILMAMGIGLEASEFIVELICYAGSHNFEKKHAPLAILKDALIEAVDRL